MISAGIRETARVIFIAPILAVTVLVFGGIGGPIVFLMFAALYFVIGPLLQVCVRIHPQPAKENQPAPWPQYLAMAFTNVLRAGAVLALCRLLLWTLLIWIGKPEPATEEREFIFLMQWDIFFGGCGLLFAFLSFVQEGLWLYRQRLAVRDVPTASVASAAIGLSELSGTVRRIENRDGPIDPNRAVMSFRWKLLGTQRVNDAVMLGSYDKAVQAFYLDDGTGRILIDPVHNDVELRRPLISVSTTFFGRRSFEILLTKHVQKLSWDERIYDLREGDRVFMIGYVEANPTAPADAAGPDRLVVRPRKEARSGSEALLQFLIPGRTPARTPHDIFIITDTTEKDAKGLLRKNFLASAAMAPLLAVLSALLVFLSVRMA